MLLQGDVLRCSRNVAIDGDADDPLVTNFDDVVVNAASGGAGDAVSTAAAKHMYRRR